MENVGTKMKASNIRKREQWKINTYWSCDILQSATATPPIQPQHPHPSIPSRITLFCPRIDIQVLHSLRPLLPTFPLELLPPFFTHVLMRIHPESLSGCDQKWWKVHLSLLPSLVPMRKHCLLFMCHCCDHIYAWLYGGLKDRGQKGQGERWQCETERIW